MTTTPLNQVVPWGRSMDEYRQMFNLSDDDLKLNILGCGDGPASFNAEMTALGHHVTSLDPIYVYSAAQIDQRISEVAQTIAAHLEMVKDNYLWDFFTDIPTLIQYRMATMQRFIADFERGKQEKRYLAGSLPTLPFADGQFDLAVCSHFLFLYSEQLDVDFHSDSLLELCRVAKEVRIFPLITLSNDGSPHLATVVETLSAHGLSTERVKVPLLFQKGADEMLRIYRH